VHLHFIWPELHGRLWHTTHPDLFQEILKTGAIVPEPNIDNSKCWKTAEGLEHYPYVRTISGVSLFDFENFAPNTYSKDYPLSNLEAFVPFRKDWHSAVWIEIDQAKIAEGFVSGADLIARWKAEGARPLSPGGAN
jgi:hypothetical protein